MHLKESGLILARKKNILTLSESEFDKDNVDKEEMTDLPSNKSLNSKF